jgi:hypothetical protein
MNHLGFYVNQLLTQGIFNFLWSWICFPQCRKTGDSLEVFAILKAVFYPSSTFFFWVGGRNAQN